MSPRKQRLSPTRNSTAPLKPTDGFHPSEPSLAGDPDFHPSEPSLAGDPGFHPSEPSLAGDPGLNGPPAAQVIFH